MTESCVVFDCHGDALVGILHLPDAPARYTGVLIIVGGPQYRVGSHRQFVVMARALADAGYPVLRFDYRGMGDSAGQARTFDSVDPDIRAAIDAFKAEVPTLHAIVAFGLCDAASAALIYGATDQRIQGLILANPWVRTVAGQAKAFVRHYYGQRLLQRAFWRKAIRGELAVVATVRSLVANLWSSRAAGEVSEHAAMPDYITRMRRGFEQFGHPTLIVLSGKDLTAREFADLCSADPAWAQLMCASSVTQLHVADADHTFSSQSSLRDVSASVAGWLQKVLEARVGSDGEHDGA